MTNKNLYIATKAYTEAKDNYTSLAFAEITEEQLKIFTQGFGILKQSTNATKICVDSNQFSFVDMTNKAIYKHSEEERELLEEIEKRIEYYPKSFIFITEKEYNKLNKLEILNINNSEVQIHKDNCFRGFAYTNKMFISIVIYTNYIDLQQLNNLIVPDSIDRSDLTEKAIANYKYLTNEQVNFIKQNYTNQAYVDDIQLLLIKAREVGFTITMSLQEVEGYSDELIIKREDKEVKSFSEFCSHEYPISSRLNFGDNVETALGILDKMLEWIKGAKKK